MALPGRPMMPGAPRAAARGRPARLVRPVGSLLPLLLLARRPSVAGEAPQDSSSGDSGGEVTHYDEAPAQAEPLSGLVNQLGPLAGEHCGVIGGLDDAGRVQRNDLELQEPVCNTSLLTNCSATYWPISCPGACPFLVEDPAVACFFKCVVGARCSEEDPDLPFPDSTISNHAMCSECSVSLCKRCSTSTACEECHGGFVLSDGGQSCVLEMKIEDRIIPVVKLLGCLAACLLLLAVIWPCLNGFHPRAQKHMVSVRRARLHRHLCKTANWQLDSRREVRQWYSLAENVHKRNIIGVGLPLFYNTICFMMLVAIVCFVSTYTLHNWLWIRSHAFGIAEPPETRAVIDFVEMHYDGGIVLDDQLDLPAGRPVIVASKLKECSERSPDEDRQALEFMAVELFWFHMGLYLALFSLSLWMGSYQKRSALRFNSHNPSMKDYAIQVGGLPKDMTDEATIRKGLEHIFRQWLPQEVDRPPKVEYATDVKDKDTYVPRPSSQIEVHAVSLKYDWSSRRQLVEGAIWNFMEVEEVVCFEQAKGCEQNQEWLERVYSNDQVIQISDTGMYDPADPATHDMTPHQAHDRIREKTLPLFEGPDKLQTTGEAYVIFRYTTDKALVSESIKQNPHAYGIRGETITFSEVSCEPTSIMWWSSGLSHARICMNMLRALGIITLMIVVLMYCFNWQYYLHIQQPYSKGGQTESGITTIVYSTIQSNVTGLVHWGIYMIAESIGFQKKDQLYRFVFVTSVVFIAMLEGFAVALLFNVQFRKKNHTNVGATFTVSTKYLGVEMSLASTLFNYLLGKWTGQFMKAFMPQVTFMCFQTLQKILYVWRCLPRPFLSILRVFLPWKPGTLGHFPFRNAEKAVDPWEIPFFADYADWVIIPFECFCSMFFLSSYVWKIFAWLICWAVGNYFYYRWMHLRFHRVNFYTTDRLNDTWMYWWGCAISVVAAQVPLWGFRSGLLFEFFEGSREVLRSTWAKLLVLLATYSVAVLLWCFAYRFIVRPHSKSKVWAQAPGLRRGKQLASYVPLVHWKDKTVHEATMHFVYSWLNTNPAYVLKCKYFFKDSDGHDTEHRKNHPLASGEDEEEVRFFEVGKEYLFLRPERLHLLDATISDFLEPEYWLDLIVWKFGWFADLFSEKVDEEVEWALEKVSAPTDSNLRHLTRRMSLGYQPINQDEAA